MNQTELRQTRFNAVPLRNVVGFGNRTAYRIHVTRGKVIASIEMLEEFTNRSAANASRFDDGHPEPVPVTRPRAWFRRVTDY